MDMKENTFDFDFNPNKKVQVVKESPKKDLTEECIMDFDFNFIDSDIIKNFTGLKMKEVDIEIKKPKVEPKATIFELKKY